MQSRITSNMTRIAAAAGLVVSTMAGVACTKNPDQTKMQYVPDMADTAALKSQRDFLAPPEGSVTRNAILYPATIEESEKVLDNPVPASAENLAAGKKLWNTYCIPCHGVRGDSQGSITDLYPAPPNLVAKDYPAHKDGFYFHKMTFGGAIMPAYGHAIAPQERWQIAHYIHELQRAAK